MKLQIKPFVESYESLVRLSQVKMIAAIKVRIGRVIVQAKEEYDRIQQVTIETIEKFEGTLLPNGTAEFKDVETRKEARKELDDLDKTEIEIRFDKFTLADLEKLDVNAWDLAAVRWLYGGLEPEETKTETEGETDDNET